MKIIKQNYKLIIIFLIISFIIQMIFSVNTSFLYKNCYIDINSTDALDNIVASIAIIEGYIPYKDLFTTSGPFTYFILSSAYLLGKLNGIFTFQIFGQCISLTLIWKLNNKNIYNQYLSIGIYLILYILILSTGATSIECCIPFLTSVIYLSNKEDTNKILEFLNGFLVGCLFMIHFIFGLLGLLAILFLSKRRKILQVFALSLPIISFIIYALFTNSFFDYINVIFNYQISSIIYNDYSLLNLIKRIIKCIPIMFFILPICTYWHNNKKISYYFILSMICLLFYFILGKESWIKFGILACYVPICLAFTNNNYIKYTYLLLLTTIVFLVPFKNFIQSYSNYYINGTYLIEYDYLIQLKEEYNPSQDSIVIVDCSSKYYLILDMNPEWYFYVDQSETGKNNAKIADEMYNYLWDGKFKGTLYITSGSGGVYENIDHYILNNLSYVSEPLAIYNWYDGELEDLY